MINPLDLQRLAFRIETLMRTSTSGRHPADELDFKNRLPQGRDRRKLPSPVGLRAMAEAGDSPDPQSYRLWLSTALDLEGFQSRNRPGSPKRMIRDMQRGKMPFGRR